MSYWPLNISLVALTRDRSRPSPYQSWIRERRRLSWACHAVDWWNFWIRNCWYFLEMDESPPISGQSRWRFFLIYDINSILLGVENFWTLLVRKTWSTILFRNRFWEFDVQFYFCLGMIHYLEDSSFHLFEMKNETRQHDSINGNITRWYSVLVTQRNLFGIFDLNASGSSLKSAISILAQNSWRNLQSVQPSPPPVLISNLEH